MAINGQKDCKLIATRLSRGGAKSIEAEAANCALIYLALGTRLRGGGGAAPCSRGASWLRLANTKKKLVARSGGPRLDLCGEKLAPISDSRSIWPRAPALIIADSHSTRALHNG